ncbi:hypothetical protein DFQ14_103219 [Halopolyspora algeriensis]|uniref:ATP synthase protein I n=1 Tax=Halopolyspora algeriensis TaxID=1500506 RepID=A0A368VTB6_9ACTN|nr:hypothetical protein [Halopolyspora algeriensis]RCW45252.1 hypothetical protein DFQ14_103219 [Halopolyspora algeriensis]TQM53029.1 hypothetical protein FHU43_2405 [Halopolyspora algeriensis]
MNSSTGRLLPETIDPGTETTETTVLRLATAMLRPALWSTLVVGLVAVLIAAVPAGLAGAVGAVSGALLVIACCWFNIAVMRWTARAQPGTVMAAAIGGYCGKFVVLLTLLLVVRETAWFDIHAFALSILAAAAVWTGGELVGFLRGRVATVTPVPSDIAAGAGSGAE